MKLNQLLEMDFSEPDEPITGAQLDELELYLKQLYSNDLNIDFAFAQHFSDRINSTRNKRQITTKELFLLFALAEKKYGRMIAKLGPEMEGVLRDINSQVNSPFVMKWNRDKGKIKLLAKTVMRDDTFKSKDKFYYVNSDNKVRKQK